MTKYPIGFNTKIEESPKTIEQTLAPSVEPTPRKSVVQVHFSSRNMTLAYYNDKFDLKVGDFVYVDGKLEGRKGQVVEVNYSFKIKLDDYKRVIAVVDTNVNGDFYIAGSQIVSFDKDAIPYEKVVTWFKAPENPDDYVSGDDDGKSFLLEDLNQMEISPQVAERGHDYYMQNNVCYVCVENNHGRALVEGGEFYEVEFDYTNGEISNLTCSCFCGYACKHEFAALLQLKETLEIINKDYKEQYQNYFAAVNKGEFLFNVVCKKNKGNLHIE